MAENHNSQPSGASGSIGDGFDDDEFDLFYTSNTQLCNGISPPRVVSGTPSSGSQENGIDDDDDEWLEDALLSMPHDIPEVSNSVGNFECSFHGVKVNFPYEPYQSQNQMMEEIIAGVQTKTHCLLESPTGTGKTAALLCALLAWQNEFARQQSLLPSCSCNFDVPGSTITTVQDPVTKELRFQRSAFVTPSPSLPTESPEGSPSASCCHRDESCSKKIGLEITPETRTENELCAICHSKYVKKESNMGEKIPIIYYTTRTHSQVSQVVKQLRQTAYARTPMTILSSRKLTCVNEEVKKNSRTVPIDDECLMRKDNFYKNKKLESGEASGPPATPVCKFFRERDILHNVYSNEFGHGKAFDIEDLLKFGDSEGLCPFYGSKLLLPTARIVFCPYNYVLYPWIRKASQINLENNIVVFDEAHNIEQICRDVASIVITIQALEKINWEIAVFREQLEKAKNVRDTVIHDRLKKLMQTYSVTFQQLLKWIEIEGKNIKLKPNSKEGYAELNLEAVGNGFRTKGFKEDSLGEHLGNVKFLRESETTPKLPSHIVEFIENLGYTLRLLYGNEGVEVPDFSALVTKKRDGGSGTESISLKLLCNNPAIAFKKFQSARTVIVASGTLSPIESFESELGINFAQKLSAKHVINRDQIWAGSLSYSGIPPINLSLYKRNQENVAIQDCLGEQIYRICAIVPCGVVVFLPSYTLMSTLRNRWAEYPQKYPLLSKLSSLKDIYYEESGQDAADFQEQMAEYRSKVSSGKGCVFFAIFRGKVSEGVDFKDNEARCVVTVGIPHLPVLDPEVVVKKGYNCKRNARNPAYLSGEAWYTCQAFRALNQGLGRCIRHKDDWGALILLEARISQPQNSGKLSLWVKDFLKSYSSQAEFQSSLSQFMANRKMMS